MATKSSNKASTVTNISGVGAGPGMSSSVSVLVNSASTHESQLGPNKRSGHQHLVNSKNNSPLLRNNTSNHTTKVQVGGSSETRSFKLSNIDREALRSSVHSSDGDSSSLKEFFHEVDDIRHSIPPTAKPGKDSYHQQSGNLNIEGNAIGTSDDELSKTPDEGEAEASWLEATGFKDIVTDIQAGKDVEEERMSHMTESLTPKQAEAVKKRVNTLRSTHGRKHNVRMKTDIRNVAFTERGSGITESSVTSNKHGTIFYAEGENSKTTRPHREHSMFKNKGGYTLTGNAVADEADSHKACVVTRAAYSFCQKRQDESEQLGFILNENKLALPYQAEMGITEVTDLSKADLVKLRRLSLLELTTVCDENNIIYSSRKPKKRYKDNGVFGVPLESLLEHDQKRNKSLVVPKIFSELIDYLSAHGLVEEGILRVSGSSNRINVLQQEIEERNGSSQQLLPDWSQLRPNDVAGLFKQFIRELPVPLLTFQYLDAFAQVDSGITDLKTKLNALNLLILLLPDAHREVLKLLLMFLESVATNQSNKMTLDNVAMIMAPNLFLIAPNGKKPKISSSSLPASSIDIAMITRTVNVVRLLITYQSVLWNVPPSLVQQIRTETRIDLKKSKEKHIYKFLSRHKDKDKADNSKKENKNLEPNTIIVKSPDYSKTQAKIKLDDSTTAGDVVDKFRRETIFSPVKKTDKKSKKKSHDIENDSESLAGKDSYLYEVGGNIGERRLEHKALMKSILSVNPDAEWIVKCKIN